MKSVSSWIFCLSLAGTCSSVFAAALRASAKNVSQTDIDAAAALVASLNSTLQAAPKKVSQTNHSAPQKRAQLDVGFRDFESNLESEVNASIMSITNSSAWTGDMRDALKSHIADAVNTELKAALKPLKMSIGKTWMALPEDEQKEAYVSQLKSGFAPIISSGMHTILSHLKLSLNRVERFGGSDTQLSKDEILKRSEATIQEGLLEAHCYGDDDKDTHSKIAKTTSNSSKHKLKRFCIASALDNVIHRLNDTSGLVSMTTRFEAGAMSLAQKAKAAKK